MSETAKSTSSNPYLFDEVSIFRVFIHRNNTHTYIIFQPPMFMTMIAIEPWS